MTRLNNFRPENESGEELQWPDNLYELTNLYSKSIRDISKNQRAPFLRSRNLPNYLTEILTTNDGLFDYAILPDKSGYIVMKKDGNDFTVEDYHRLEESIGDRSIIIKVWGMNMSLRHVIEIFTKKID